MARFFCLLLLILTLPARAEHTPHRTGIWKNAQVGDIIQVRLRDLHPGQAVLGFDQIYSRLGRYELQPLKKFDDFCADGGWGGLASASANASLQDPSSYHCTITNPAQRDTTRLPPVVVGPKGKTLFLADGHHGLSTYFELPDGGPDLPIHVMIKANLAKASKTQFWQEIQSRNLVWLRDAQDRTITPMQLPVKLGLHMGMQDDRYRSLVYFTRDIGYSKPSSATDFLEFYWARWLRSNFTLGNYDTTALNTIASDPTTDTGYLGAVWNASLLMVAATDPIISGKTGTDLGKLSSINAGYAWNKGTFADLQKMISASKPGKIAYTLYYRQAHGL